MSNLPSFFQESFVDDTKYESLLEDLRAHDLLGPTLSSSDPPPNLAKAPPPGFESGPPGLIPTKADIDWARGQHEFLKLKEDYHKQSSPATGFATSGGSGFGGGLGLSGLGLGGFSNGSIQVVDQKKSPTNSPDFGPQFDQNAMSTIQSLGLDDDEQSVVSAQSPERKQDPQVVAPEAPPPLPPNLPPPLPPNEPPQVPHRAWVYPPPAKIGPPGWTPPLPPPLNVRGTNPLLNRSSPAGDPTSSHTGAYPPPMRVNQIRSKIMTPRDIQFVITQQTKQLRTSDPFSDDYYYYNYAQKRNRQAASAATGTTHASPPSLPLPSWKLQHVRSIDPRDSSKAAKSRSWEKQHQVLGRNDKASLYRPRELLKLPSSGLDESAVAEVCDDDDSPVTGGHQRVFSNASWQKRYEIEEGIQCLLRLQDARHILDARGINIQQFHTQDEDSMGSALAELRRKTAALLRTLAEILGVVPAAAESDDSLHVRTSTVHRIYSSMKGKTLICRVLPLLHPSARFVLLPILLRAFLTPDFQQQGQTQTRKSDDTGPLGLEIESVAHKLAKTLVLVLMYHSATPGPEVFVQCAASALEHQTQDSLTKILHDRPRAEVLQALLQKGGQVCGQDLDSAVGTRWTEWQTRFVNLARAIQQTTTVTNPRHHA